MLFRRKIPRSCSYCRFGAQIDDSYVLCTRKGLRPIQGKCLRFKYDPCKRIPPKPKALDFSKYNSSDFTL